MKSMLFVLIIIMPFLAHSNLIKLNWNNYNDLEKIQIIEAYRVFFKDIEIEEYLNQNISKNKKSEIRRFINLISQVQLFSSSWAITKITNKNMCNYGAWPSHYYKKTKKCQNPFDTIHYKKQIKYYKKINPTCNKKEHFLCNPSLVANYCIPLYPTTDLTERCMKRKTSAKKLIAEYKKNTGLKKILELNYDLAKKYCKPKQLAYFCLTLQEKLKEIELEKNRRINSKIRKDANLSTAIKIAKNPKFNPSKDYACADCPTDENKDNKCIPPESNYLADNAFYRSVKPLSDNNKTISKECIKKIQEDYPDHKAIRYAKCSRLDAKPLYRKNLKPCISETLVNATHSLINRISLCMGVNPKLIFPIFAHESGFIPNSLSPHGCLGFGQLGGPMLSDITKKGSKIFKKSLDKCKEFIKKPYKKSLSFFNKKGKSLRCRLINNPESIVTNVLASIMAIKFNTYYLKRKLFKSTIKKIIPIIGKANLSRFKQQLMILSHNAGAGVISTFNFYIKEKKNLTKSDLNLFYNPEKAPEGSFSDFLRDDYINTTYTEEVRDKRLKKGFKEWPKYLNSEKKRERRNFEVARYMYKINKYSDNKDSKGNLCSEKNIYSPI